jgi:hypothetical protein
MTNETGTAFWAATTTVKTGSYSPDANQNFSDFGAASSTLKILIGSAFEQVDAVASSTVNIQIGDGNTVFVGETGTLAQFMPLGGTAEITLNAVTDLTDGLITSWTASSSVSSAKFSVVLKMPQALALYSVKVNGAEYGRFESDMNSEIYFTYAGGFSTKNFSVSPAPMNDAGAFASPVDTGAATSSAIAPIATSTVASTSTLPIAEIPIIIASSTESVLPLVMEPTTTTIKKKMSVAPKKIIKIPKVIKPTKPAEADVSVVAAPAESIKKSNWITDLVHGIGGFFNSIFNGVGRIFGR